MGLDPELIRLSFRFESQTTDRVSYLNLAASKEEAILAVKSLLSTHDSLPSSISIFCDGSFTPDKGGAGAAFCPSRNSFLAYSIPPDTITSNQECEALGLVAALQMVR